MHSVEIQVEWCHAYHLEKRSSTCTTVVLPLQSRQMSRGGIVRPCRYPDFRCIRSSMLSKASTGDPNHSSKSLSDKERTNQYKQIKCHAEPPRNVRNSSNARWYPRSFTHVPTVPVVGVGKERRTTNWSTGLPEWEFPVYRATLRITGPVLAYSWW